jgi:molybdopterin-guanine dinucleotide biosynthesis protein A
MDMDLVRRLLEASEGFDGAVFVAADGRPEPTFAVYRRCVLPAAREALAQGERRASELIRRCRIRLVALGPGEGPGNVNTPADFEALRGSRDA